MYEEDYKVCGGNQMKYDRPLLVLALGILASIPYELFTRIMLSFGIGKYSVYQLSSLIITLNRPTAILGALTSFLVGMVIAIIFYHSLKKIGTDYITVKGLVTGLFGWAGTELIYTWLIEGRGFAYRPISDYYLQVIGSAIFGITLGLLFRLFIVPHLEKEKKFKV